ncbi:acyltransferase domain-containing protein [Actinomadura madurae]|uniref:acyltransferase domain-containing protein n=1 Tax=Actinomadura madurae TaxID=1993 RepID=UPI003558BD9A
MASIAASEDEVAAVLADAGDPADIAAVNGPASVVVSGAEEAVLAVAAAFADRGRRTKRLPVGHAFHSRLMEPMLEEFGEVVSGLSFHPARIPVFSDVSGDFAGTGEMRAPEYWVRHVREPVRFAAMVRRAAVLGAGAFLELGPDASLSAMARDCLEAAGGDDAGTAPGDPVCVPVLRKDRPEPETLTTALAELYVRGTHVDWAACSPERERAASTCPATRSSGGPTGCPPARPAGGTQPAWASLRSGTRSWPPWRTGPTAAAP